jgi:hypothetical protein
MDGGANPRLLQHRGSTILRAIASASSLHTAMSRHARLPTIVLLFAVLLSTTAVAAEFAVLSPDTWDQFAPQGKEVDAIYGDFVLRNEHLVAVVAQPLDTRNANMTVRGVGGCLIDLTERQAQNDQLSCYYPGAGRFQFTAPDKMRGLIDGKPIDVGQFAAAGSNAADSVAIELASQPIDGRPRLLLRYTLAKGAQHLLVETIYSNPTDKPVEDDLSDAIRADRTFTFGTDAATSLFWADDEWFRQSYGVIIPGYAVKGTGQRGTLLQLEKDGSSKLKLEPGQSHSIARQIYPASSLLAVRGVASQMAGSKVGRLNVLVGEPSPVAQARVALSRDGKPYAAGRTDASGRLEFLLPVGAYEYVVTSLDGRTAEGNVSGGGDIELPVSLGKPSHVVATITTASGEPTPAKVSFTGTGGTANPDWGPDSGDTAVKNVYYTHTGSFKQAIAPGKYDVIVSYGPEHDAVFTSIEVPAGGDAQLEAVLKRTVHTRGWISADFHSHSSPSGDNTSSQFGRVQNLLCEQIEFAPCTEHNRIDTYAPHLKRMKVEHLLATCTGMELTGGPLPVNHQNAFPLVYKPHTQDGGAPVTDVDPVVQAQRLALWDNKSDKLVQMNHPNLPQILGDRNEDGQPDAGFERMFGFVDVIEVHPPQGIFDPPEKGASGKLERNPVYHWMQMLNLGYRQPAVINTDSHYNYHESGYFRNFLKSSTDDPARIDTMEMVHAAERGHVVVSTGPFLSVEASAARAEGRLIKAIPGDDLAAADGSVQLAIRVQCPNWLDINRVQVFLNGRAAKELNFTRRTTPERFSDETVRFQATVPLALAADTHIIVAAIGEGLTLGPVMGPNHGGKLPPAAVSNPIFADVDGGGFKPNGDLLDVPIAIAPR